MDKETEVWFAMRATYRRELEAMHLLEKANLGCFIPMQYKISIRRGRKVRALVPVIRNLVFVHARPSEVQRFKSQITYLQYITDTRSGQKIVIPDHDMQRFIAVAGTYNDHLLYFQPEELNLSKGTKVRITGGDFEGQEGVFLKVKGARDRWKIQCKLPPKTKRFCPLKTFNNAPLKSLDRWGYYYFRFSSVRLNRLRNKLLANYLKSGGNELATVRISAFCVAMLSNNSFICKYSIFFRKYELSAAVL